MQPPTARRIFAGDHARLSRPEHDRKRRDEAAGLHGEVVGERVLLSLFLIGWRDFAGIPIPLFPIAF